MRRSFAGCVVIAVLAPVAAAFAHTRWADGEPIPAWVQQHCCGVSDAHHLRPDQVHRTPGGFRVDGYRDEIPEQRLDPSPDGEWWVFYRNYADGSQSIVYCFFGPDLGS